MLMKRRGLNFVTEHHDELLTEETLQAVEEQLDNVAPRIIAILGLSASSDTAAVRNHLVQQCLVYQESQQAKHDTTTLEYAQWRRPQHQVHGYYLTVN